MEEKASPKSKLWIYSWGICLTSPIFSFLWVQQFVPFPQTVFFCFSLLIALGILIFRRTLSKSVLIFLIYLGGLSTFWGLLAHPHLLPPQTQTPLKIVGIQESKTQIRFSLEDPQKTKMLGIYYKPRHPYPPSGFNYAVGTIQHIRETKTQLQLTLQLAQFKILAIVRKKILPLPKTELTVGKIVQIQTAEKKYFRKLSTLKKRDIKNLQKGILYTGYISHIVLTPHQKPQISKHFLPTIYAKNFQIGDFVQATPKKEWREIQPFKRPYYLFAQGFQWTTSIQSLKKLPLPNRLNPLEYTAQKLVSLYKTSQYPSFYWSVLLGKKPLDKGIYKLFQKNELVHLLVISGSHIDIIISFFMFVLTAIFAILHVLTQPNQTLTYLRESHFFSVRGKSLPLFITLTTILIFYLLLTGSQQAGARAIISFILAGILYHLGMKISVFVLLGLSIALCFLFYPEWITYPVGLLYSSTAVLSLYLCLPLIFRINRRISSPVIKILLSSILTSTLVSLFIAPLSFYFFHYYNFISIFTNIPMGLLFFVFIYVASLGSLLGMIYIPLGMSVLKISDICITGMLEFLKITEHISTLKVYIHTKIQPIALILFYVAIVISIQTLKKYFHIKEIQT